MALSLNLHLRHHVSVEMKGVPLLSTGPNKFGNPNFSTWSYTRPINIYLNGDLLDPSFYDVYPNSGEIEIRDEIGSGQLTADFWFNYLPIKPAYMGEHQTPYLSIDIGPNSESPFEIGGNNLFIMRFRLDLYASNPDQRDDFSYEVANCLEGINVPLIDFNIGFPYDSQGKLNRSFSVPLQTVGKIQFSDITVHRNPTGIQELSEISRALISCTGSTQKNYK